MIVLTIGFTKKSAREFFELISENGVRVLVDVRLQNSSQLAGFAKGGDLPYFLQKICGCAYRHELIFAPSKELMDAAKAKKIPMGQFRKLYAEEMEAKNALPYFAENYLKEENVCLLCSEETADRCHRGVLADLLASAYPEITVRHL